MTKRQSVLFGEIEKGGSFADVGCDHGYIAEAVLYSKLCDKVIISDVSEKCLKKADDRLKLRYSGQYEAIVSDGFDSLPRVDQAVVAVWADGLSRVFYREERSRRKGLFCSR